MLVVRRDVLLAPGSLAREQRRPLSAMRRRALGRAAIDHAGAAFAPAELGVCTPRLGTRRAAFLLCTAAASATVHTHGYFATRDGTKLRYDVLRPDGPGRHPVLVNYEGYAAGSDATDNGVAVYSDRLLKRGYALVGVSVRGTGCSEGVFDPFAETMGRDGADAIEWAARQPWSNGRVGMIGVSFGAITQLLTAANRPPHLRAITPDSATSDLYRDVTYPGGVLEYDFTFAWTGDQKEGGYQYATTVALADGDTQCEKNFAQHEIANEQRRQLEQVDQARAELRLQADQRPHVSVQPVAGRAAARPDLRLARDVRQAEEALGQLLERQPRPRALLAARPEPDPRVPRPLRPRCEEPHREAAAPEPRHGDRNPAQQEGQRAGVVDQAEGPERRREAAAVVHERGRRAVGPGTAHRDGLGRLRLPASRA